MKFFKVIILVSVLCGCTPHLPKEDHLNSCSKQSYYTNPNASAASSLANAQKNMANCN